MAQLSTNEAHSCSSKSDAGTAKLRILPATWSFCLHLDQLLYALLTLTKTSNEACTTEEQKAIHRTRHNSPSCSLPSPTRWDSTTNYKGTETVFLEFPLDGDPIQGSSEGCLQESSSQEQKQRQTQSGWENSSLLLSGKNQGWRTNRSNCWVCSVLTYIWWNVYKLNDLLELTNKLISHMYASGFVNLSACTLSRSEGLLLAMVYDFTPPQNPWSRKHVHGFWATQNKGKTTFALPGFQQ